MNTPSCVVPLEGEPLDCAVSPSSGLLAAGIVTGKLQLASFSCAPSGSGSDGSQLSYQLVHTISPPADRPKSQPKKQKKKNPADDGDGAADGAGSDVPSCRAVCFTHSGDAVLAGYSDNVVRSYDATTGKLSQVFAGEHDQQLSRLFALEPHVFASGDEEGLVVLWDARTGGSTYRYTQHTDYITDFALHSRDQALVVTSGDATMSVHDLRKRKALARSEDDCDDELLSCAVVKGGKKVVAGTQSGVLHIYSWGYFNDCSDRFPGHPESVQALVAFDEDTLLTGSSDGGVRVVGVLPNRLLGILGQHNEDFPVERLALSYNRRVLASTSHDAAVKLWDLSILHEDDGDGDGEGEEEEDEEEGGGVGAGEVGVAAGAGPSGRKPGGGRGGEGVGHDSDDSDDEGEGDDDSEDGDSSDWEESDDGEEEEEEEDDGEEEGVKQGGSGDGEGEGDRGASGNTAGATGSGAGAKKQRSAAGPVAARKAAAERAAAHAGSAPGGGNAAAAGCADDGGDGDGSEDESDDSDGGPKRKRAKRERTKWTKGAEQKKKPAGNFFADLL